MSAAYSSRMRRSSPFFPLADAVAAARNLAAKRESLGWGLWKSYRVRGGDAARVVRGCVRWRRGGGAALVRGGVRYRRGGFPRGRDAGAALRNNYARALFLDTNAALDDLREAVTTLEELERIARRVCGSVHPLVVDINSSLLLSRVALRVREGA